MSKVWRLTKSCNENTGDDILKDIRQYQKKTSSEERLMQTSLSVQTEPGTGPRQVTQMSD
jgi:hypothetical protein